MLHYGRFFFQLSHHKKHRQLSWNWDSPYVLKEQIGVPVYSYWTIQKHHTSLPGHIIIIIIIIIIITRCFRVRFSVLLFLNWDPWLAAKITRVSYGNQLRSSMIGELGISLVGFHGDLLVICWWFNGDLIRFSWSFSCVLMGFKRTQTIPQHYPLSEKIVTMILQLTCLQPFACERWIFCEFVWWLLVETKSILLKCTLCCKNTATSSSMQKIIGPSGWLVSPSCTEIHPSEIYKHGWFPLRCPWNPWICGNSTTCDDFFFCSPKRQPTWPWSGLKCQHFKPDGNPTRPETALMWLAAKDIQKVVDCCGSNMFKLVPSLISGDLHLKSFDSYYWKPFDSVSNRIMWATQLF